MEIISIGKELHGRRTITLDIGGENKVITFIVRWQGVLNLWTMTIQDETGADIVTHIPLIAGIDINVANLLRVYAYKLIGALVVLPLNDELWGVDPGKDNISTNYALAWGDSL